ncbi:flagellar biosynthesis protein FlhB [Marinomonas ostreistagni]|uniref:Flagellar biosynthetic protein FlhB n=1 Tax=Marinomonas ostreistagni TaxID=359209 RepID=A0ABS0Z6H2_9GAMM|nr:flagellar biosynthesis protein FlhB [Marinomonas ostreistagni]MBJ7549254.1 flagellar biosynthesis protein FlhB [Marinomonas ostreistagni]
MAENEDGTEKTEDASAKKLQEARDKGNIARSRDLSSAALLVVSALSMYMVGMLIVDDLMNLYAFNFSIAREDLFDVAMMIHHLYVSIMTAIDSLTVFMLIVAAAGIIGSVAFGGFNFSWEPIVPKLSKMSPIQGIKRMFSVQSLVELLKSTLKILLVGTVAAFVLLHYLPMLTGLAFESIGNAMSHTLDTLIWAFILISSSLIIIAAIDVPFQAWQHKDKLKMTKQEVKDEYKQSEGDPQVKGRIRQLQRQAAMRRMMSDVPQADVIITNPTHFSVALKYDQEKGKAPIMVAKGSDFIALKIREIGNYYDIPVIQSPALTRAVYKHTEIGEEVPEGLFKVIAQLLAYVYQLRLARTGQKAPDSMPSFDIPEEFRWNGE